MVPGPTVRRNAATKRAMAQSSETDLSICSASSSVIEDLVDNMAMPNFLILTTAVMKMRRGKYQRCRLIPESSMSYLNRLSATTPAPA